MPVTALPRLTLVSFLLAFTAFTAAPSAAQDIADEYRACIFPDLDHMDDVIKTCTRVISSRQTSDASQSAALLGRGNMYRRMGQYDRAIADYNAALKLDPNNLAPILTSRGNAWRGKKNTDRAIADHSEAIKLDPTYATAWGNRGNVWSDKGEWDKAIADYDKAIELNPKFATAFYNRGLAYEAKKNKDHASADYQAALQLQPGFAEAARALKEIESTN
jgi:tetratricopeptide (TPR) repeat protein